MLPLRDTEADPMEMSREMESDVVYWDTDPQNGLGPLPQPSTSKLGIPLPSCITVSNLHFTVDNPKQRLFYMNESTLVQPVYFS